MSVKHVSASKTPGLLGAIRKRSRQAAGRPAQKSAVVPGESKTPAGDDLAAAPVPQAAPKATAEDALTDDTSGIVNPSAGTPSNAADAAAQLLDAVGPAPAPASAAVDYHAILTRTIESLALNNAETRGDVYERARRVVEERLKEAAPAMSSHMIAVERIAFDRAVAKVEAEQAERQRARAAPVVAKPAPPAEPTVAVATAESSIVPDAAEAPPVTPVAAPPAAVEQADSAPAVVIARRPRPVPPIRQTHGGTLRLFALIGVLIAGLAGYWLVAGKPDLAHVRDMARIGSKPAQPQPSESADSATPAAPSEQQAASAPEQSDATADATAAAPPDAAAEAIDVTSPEAYNVQLATFLSMCRPAQTAYGQDPCGNLQPRPFGGPGVEPRNAVEWIAMYASLSEIPMRPPRSPAFTMPVPETEAAPDRAAAATAPARSGNATARERYARGKDLASNDNLEGAVADFSEAIRLDPKFADAYVQRGHAMFKTGNVERAIADFSQALQIDPHNVAAFKARGMAMLYKGDENGAIINLTKAIQYAELDPGAVPAVEVFFARRSRATLYGRKQLYERELADLTAMIDGYWRDPGLAAALRTTYRDQGAAALMASIYRLRAGVHQKRSDLDAAIGDLSLALQLDSQRTLQYLIERGRLLEAAGRREQAIADYRQALELSPNNTDVKNSLVRLKGPT
jgi:tetratricopeptide (TPR) repeat protein